MRHRQFSLLAKVLLLISAILLSRTAMAFPGKFNAIDLGTLGGPASEAYGVNNKGQVVGVSELPDNSIYHAFFWQKSKITDLGTLWPDPNKPGHFLGVSVAYGINNKGQVVGVSTTADLHQHAFLWPDPKTGKMKDLGVPNGLANSSARAINDQGLIVGSGQGEDPQGMDFVITYSNNMWTTLPMPGPNAFHCSATGVNNSGAISITAINQGYSTIAAYLYTNNIWLPIGGTGEYPGSHATGSGGINASGDIVGGVNQVIDLGNNTVGFHYDGAGWHPLNPLKSDSFSVAYGINSFGGVVGSSSGDDENAVYWISSSAVDLTAQIANNPGWQLNRAAAINDMDQIVGAGMINGQDHAFLLTLQPRHTEFMVCATSAALLAVNSVGQGGGSGGMSGGSSSALLFQNGTITNLGTLSGYQDSFAYGLNDGGQVVGLLANPDPVLGEVGHAFLFSNGVMTDLGTLGGQSSQANSINNSGWITGVSAEPDPGWAPNAIRHAFLYDGTRMRSLGTLGGMNSAGFGINAGSQVAGWSETGVVDGAGNAVRHAFLYSGGLMTDLGTLGGVDSQARAVSNSAHVVGWSEAGVGATGSAFNHAFFFDSAGMHDLGVLSAGGVGESFAYALNNRDEVVGVNSDATGVKHAFMWSDGLMLDLNSLAPPGSLFTLQAAYGVNDADQIVGSALVPMLDGVRQEGFLMSPILLTRLTVAPATVAGGLSAKGTVTLSFPAPPPGVVISLSNTNPAASVPLSVTVPPGHTTAGFTIPTLSAAGSITGVVSAALGSDLLTASLTVRPIGVKSLSISPNPVIGGVSAAGQVTLECAAPLGGILVALSSSHPGVAAPTASGVLIPAGSKTGSFAVNTVSVAAATHVKFTASANGLAKSTTLTVDP